MPVAELVGGPLDGEVLAKASAPPWAWVDARGWFWRRPRAGATLYRAAGSRRGVAGGTVARYEPAAPGWGFCPACGCLHRAASSCSLCGGALA